MNEFSLSITLGVPLIGAFIGYVTNYVAVKMLFHPKREVRILFIPVQGVFPKRQKAFAKKLGEVVSSELISVRDLTSKISEKAGSERVVKIVSDHIEQVITKRLPEVLPMLALVLNARLIGIVKGAFVAELKGLMEEVLASITSEIEGELDIHQMVEQKVANFSADKLEEILFAIMRREFRFIEVVGGVLGFLIGVIQVALMPLLN